MVYYKTSVLINFTKFARKHQCERLIFNEVAGPQSLILSYQEIPAQMFSCEFCGISGNTFFSDGCFCINTYSLYSATTTICFFITYSLAEYFFGIIYRLGTRASSIFLITLSQTNICDGAFSENS